MVLDKPRAREEQERARVVQELRDRYIRGTLDEILIPEEPSIARLLADLFPNKRRS